MATAVRPQPPRRAHRGATQQAGETAARIDRAVTAHAARLERELRGVTSSVERRRLIARASAELRLQLTGIVAQARAAVSRPGALQGAYEQIGAVGWRQRVTEYVREAAGAFERAATAAARDGLSETARRRAMREAARDALGYKMRRIATSEAFNAAVENDLSRMIAAGVPAVRWVTTRARPCPICRALADSDLQGLGPGVYALDALPLPPHPFCRCRRIPVELDDLVLAVARPQAGAIRVPGELRIDQARKVRGRVAQHIAASERHPITARIRAALGGGGISARRAAAGGRR